MTGSSSGSGTSSKKKVAGNGGQHGQQASQASGQAKMASPMTKPQSPRKAGRGRKRPLDQDAGADPTTGTATDITTSTSSTSTSRRLVFLLGHSFVRRLEQYIFPDNKFFNLEDFNVVMKGFSGADMSTLQYSAQSHSEDLLGSSVILQIWGNDLNSPHVEPIQL